MHSSFPFDSSQNAPNLSCQELWSRVRASLREQLGEANFDLWFAETKLASATRDEIILLVPGSMYMIWIEENFKNSLISTFTRYLGGCDKILFRIDESAEVPSTSGGESKEPLPADDTKDLEIRVGGLSERELLEKGHAVGLMGSYRFDTFVPGENSELAYAAARAVADQPGKTYQPLFFHSASGLGKTHLLNAIGWESLRQRPKSKILLVTAEQFANEYIDAIQKQTLGAFRKRFREADLLMIDDVQFFGGKEGLQNEFFHTFNRLSDTRKQIVLASDCPASEITQLEERLVTRFQWGLAAEIHRPGLETRAAILRKKRDDWKMAVDDESIDYIVSRVHGNVRALEGALIRVSMSATMNEKALSIPEIAELLADICDDSETRNIGAEEIKAAVAEHYDIEIAAIDGKKRTARIAEARQVAMFLVRDLTDWSLVETARAFGKDHGTVIYAVKKIKKRMQDSGAFKSSVELIKRRLIRCTGSGDVGRARQGKAIRDVRPSPNLGQSESNLKNRKRFK